MDETAFLLLIGVVFIGAMVLLMALVTFLPVLVQLLFGFFFNPDYRKQHPGFWKLWARYRLRIAWSHFAGAMWKERNDDEFITDNFKEELKVYAKRRPPMQPSMEKPKAKINRFRSYMKYIAAEIKNEWPLRTKVKAADTPPKKESSTDKSKKDDDNSEKFPALLNAQLVALHFMTGDQEYREAFDSRLQAAGIIEQPLKDAVFNYTLGIIKTQHKEDKLSDTSFVTSGIFNLILPALPRSEEEYLSEEIFTPSEVMKIFDEAEWRYWNDHERKMPDEVWGEIFRYSRHGGAKLMTGTMDRLEKLGLSTDQVGAMLRNDQVIIGNYKWAGRTIKPEDTGSTLSSWETGAKVCNRFNSSFSFHDDGTAIIEKYRGSDEKVAVPSTLDGYRVTEVGDYAFMNAMNLSYVFLPEGITDIGVDAFTNTRGNEVTVTIPRSLLRVRGNPFRELFAHLVIPVDHPRFVLADGVLFDKVERKLISYPYQGRPVTWLNAKKTGIDYEVPRGTRSIGNRAFSPAHNLSSVLLPEGICSIGDYAFSECDNLAQLKLPRGLRSIGSGAFQSCSHLASITLPDSLIEIGDNPFGSTHCFCFLSEHHPRFEIVDGVLFDKTEKRLVSYPYGNKNEEYQIPNNTLCIGESAFINCKNLTSVTLPEGLLSIKANAFTSCAGLRKLALPEGLRSIGNGAFENCTNISTVHFPQGLIHIGNSAFSWCENLVSITLLKGLQSIGDYAFNSCENLTSITLPEGLKSIGDHAFRRCSGLTSFVLPSGLESIGEFTFGSCKNCISITLPEGLKNIGAFAFSGCTNLASITLPEGLQSIGHNAFMGCKALTALNIPDSLEDIGAFLIDSPDFKLTISLGNPYIFMADGMLYNKKDATLVVCLSKGKAEAVSFPSWVKAIGGDAFRDCTNLVAVRLNEGLESIGDYAFYACSDLTVLTLPKGLVRIGRNAFDMCSSLKSVVLPEGLESIGDNAFFVCNSLQSVYIPASVTDIGHMPFSWHSGPTLTVERGSYAEAWAKYHRYPIEIQKS